MADITATKSVPQTNVPWVHSPFFEEELTRRSPPAELADIAVRLNRDGFVLLDGVGNGALFDRIATEVEPLFREPLAIEQARVQDAWERGAPAVRELAVDVRVLGLLRFLYEREPIPFQTLNFKQGSQQRGHADSMHFSCLPPRFMCGVWVALEDVDAGNGPLFYYPGSHRLPELSPADLAQSGDDPRYGLYEDFVHALMEKHGIEPVEFHAKKGDALLWSSAIIHGGRPIRDAGRTRWSQVTHYFFESCVYYTPVYSELAAGEYLLRENVRDIRTGMAVPLTFNGTPIVADRLRNGRHHIGLSEGARSVALDEAHERIARLEQEVNTVRNELDVLRSSRSFKLATTIAAAARQARRLRPS